jgi:glycosyltransferase involved in cell wall biosynthesis
MTAPSRRIVFVSGNRVWGGSEELWSAAAVALAERGHRVRAYKSRVDAHEPRIRRLRDLGCAVRDLTQFPLSPRKVFPVLMAASHQLGYAHELARLTAGLASSSRPDLVVVSQGGNFDGFHFAEVCRRLGLPYVLIAQKASDLYWPSDRRRARIAAVYALARAVFFVSEHNRRLTEEQLGLALPHASIVRNPFLVPWERRGDWPPDDETVRLACIGRLYPMEKGQDLLLRVLARPRWRAHPLHVDFYGSGVNDEGLQAMAQHLGVMNVTFAGFTREVDAIWATHHGLILPSRCEGLPLALVETMLSGRIAIVTDVGGSGEVIADGTTGFLATAASEDAIDEAMERAWSRREQWRAIGELAADQIRTMIPEDPAAVFAKTLLEYATV